MTYHPALALALALVVSVAAPGFAFAQDAAPSATRRRPPPPSPEAAEVASAPQKMEVPGEAASIDRGPAAIGATRLALKNTTRDSLDCTLAVSGRPSRRLTFAPGEEFADEFRSYPDLALTCPAIRRSAYAPLLLGKRYVFVRVAGTPQLVEVAPPPPRP
ncbi:MAG: hypothetical protein EPO51_06025 [Phenylobacterium sp.]|uniref:hypothetical protein n=1 Tax=Phenylobacterium sp. TaxID=1871053 RepID=UPI001220D10F|nr:hypothetical protein [Phenylobacterium sp.]TAJ73191.1 MAG: hypothetical protein EPO51_06025 [Phenylobacterium sp.]